MTTVNPLRRKNRRCKEARFRVFADAPGRDRRQTRERNLSLDDAMKLFEEGVQLSRDCQKYLEQAEGKVEILLKKAGGEMAAEPFDPEAEEES